MLIWCFSMFWYEGTILSWILCCEICGFHRVFMPVTYCFLIYVETMQSKKLLDSQIMWSQSRRSPPQPSSKWRVYSTDYLIERFSPNGGSLLLLFERGVCVFLPYRSRCLPITIPDRSVFLRYLLHITVTFQFWFEFEFCSKVKTNGCRIFRLQYSFKFQWEFR